MAHHHHQVGLGLLRGTGWETEAPDGAQLDINGLGLIDPQPQPSVPWSWPLMGVTRRGPHYSGFPGGNPLSRTFLLPIPRDGSVPLWTKFSWCPREPDQWKLLSQRLGHRPPNPRSLNGSREVRDHRAVGWQREVVIRMEPGLIFTSPPPLVCLLLTLVPSQTTPTFCSFSQEV